MQLISNWRDVWRMTSFNMPALGLALLGFLEKFPDAVISVYVVLPPDVRAAIAPEHIRYAAYAIIAIGAVSRVVRQRSLDKPGPVPGGSGPVGG